MEQFTAIIFEIKRIGETSFTNITADVLADPAPKGNIGVMNNGYLDRVAEPGRLSFSIDNSTKNSHATLGYYGLGGAGQIGFGTEVRVGFTYEGRTKYKWRGWVEPGGVVATPGIKGPRRVDVSCRDWFGLIADFPLDFLAYATNKRIDEAAALVIASLPSAIRPTYTEYNTGSYTFPAMFDLMKSETTALGEFNKLAVSEMGMIYGRGNEWDGFTFVQEAKLTRYNTASNTQGYKTSSETTDLFLLSDGTSHLKLSDNSSRLLLTELQTFSFTDADVSNELGKSVKNSLGRHFANYIKTSITSRRVDTAATTVLWTMEGATEVAAGTTVSGIRGRYRDPNGGASYVNCIAGTTPAATTDYKAYANSDGTGTDLTANCVVTATFGTAEVQISIQNTGVTDFWVGGRSGGAKFQVRGQGVYAYDATEIVLDFNPGSIIGRRIVNFDMVYMSDPVEAKRLLQLSVFKDAANYASTIESYPLLANRDKKNMMAWMTLEPGHRAYFEETMSVYPAFPGVPNSFINGYEFEIVGKQMVVWSPCLYPQVYVPES